MRNGQDLRKRPYIERKAALRSLLPEDSAIQYVEHAERQGYKLFEAACRLGLEGIVSRNWIRPNRSGKSKVWIKVKNPRQPAATRAADGTF
jgi:bifunctional non-homologous end joining protein LigD